MATWVVPSPIMEHPKDIKAATPGETCLVVLAIKLATKGILAIKEAVLLDMKAVALSLVNLIQVEVILDLKVAVLLIKVEVVLDLKVAVLLIVVGIMAILVIKEEAVLIIKQVGLIIEEATQIIRLVVRIIGVETFQGETISCVELLTSNATLSIDKPL